MYLPQEKECPKCKQTPFSIADRNYLELFKNCWDCDKKDWQDGKLSLEEFEKRETISIKNYENIF